MARAARESPRNYNEIRLATEARRRELVAKMRATRARTPQPRPDQFSPDPMSEVVPEADQTATGVPIVT